MHDVIALRKENILLEKEVIEAQFYGLRLRAQLLQAREAQLQADEAAAAEAAPQQDIAASGVTEG